LSTQPEAALISWGSILLALPMPLPVRPQKKKKVGGSVEKRVEKRFNYTEKKSQLSRQTKEVSLVWFAKVEPHANTLYPLLRQSSPQSLT
jgi:hypothetical protein